MHRLPKLSVKSRLGKCISCIFQIPDIVEVCEFTEIWKIIYHVNAMFVLLPFQDRLLKEMKGIT